MMYASSFVLHFADFRDSHLAQTSVSIVPDGGSTHWCFAQSLGWKMDVSPGSFEDPQFSNLGSPSSCFESVSWQQKDVCQKTPRFGTEHPL